MKHAGVAWVLTAIVLAGCAGSQDLNPRAGGSASTVTAVVSASQISATVTPTTNATATVASSTAVAPVAAPSATPKATAVAPATTPPPTTTVPAPTPVAVGSCEGYNFSKVPEWAAVFADFRSSVCAEGYALVNFAEAKPSLSVIAIHQTDGNNPQKLGYWTSLEDRNLDTGYTVEALAASGMPVPIARALYDALGGSHPGLPAKSVSAAPATVNSVVIAFLNAVAAGDAATAEALEVPGRSPSSSSGLGTSS
jgi:hypothetical protein